jgi:hypothetical protein
MAKRYGRAKHARRARLSQVDGVLLMQEPYVDFIFAIRKISSFQNLLSVTGNMNQRVTLDGSAGLSAVSLGSGRLTKTCRERPVTMVIYQPKSRLLRVR